MLHSFWISLNTPKAGGVSKRKNVQTDSQTSTNEGFVDVESRPEGVKAAKAKRNTGKGKSVAEIATVWEMKKDDLVRKERLSRLAILDTLLTKPVPLTEREESAKNKLLADYSQPSEDEPLFGNNDDSDYSETEDLIRRDQAELSLERCSQVHYPLQPEVEFGFPQVCYCGAHPVLATSNTRNDQGEWISDLPTVLPIRTKRLDIFPKDIQKQVSEAKRMEVRGRARKGKEATARESRGVLRRRVTPPFREPVRRKRREGQRRSPPVTIENADEPIEQEEEDAREEELQPEEGASEAEVSGGRNDEEGVSEGEELETSLNAARSGGSEEDSEGSPLLIRRGNDEDDDERRSPVLTSPRERTPVPIGGGAVQTEKCGEFFCQLRGRAKPIPAVKDLIFRSEYEEAARAKLLGDSTMNVVIDKYDTALKGALDELELAKKEFAEKEEVSARQLNKSRANLQKLNGMMTRTVAQRDEFKAALESS
ncbi:hypothetical protein Bca52824_073323 [Brassica carinata]|uniref:Uncharacterized protein n=1 Tax=Brassica carinata TaxID=52824 RepID=A0A8X7QF73_BRACI|nr:hypothetical protein Bca52824_073323 [Brassica carinata]